MPRTPLGGPRMNLRVDRLADLIASHFKVVGGLHAHPEFGTGPEVPGKPQSRVGRDRPLAVDDLADADLRHPDCLGEGILG